MEAVAACQLCDVAQEALGVAVVGIDEGQFVSGLALASPFLEALSGIFSPCWFRSSF
jgi:hypothetical protein